MGCVTHTLDFTFKTDENWKPLQGNCQDYCPVRRLIRLGYPCKAKKDWDKDRILSCPVILLNSKDALIEI